MTLSWVLVLVLVLALASCANSSDLDDASGGGGGTSTGGLGGNAGDASSNGGSSASGGSGGNLGGQSGSAAGGVGGASGGSAGSGGAAGSVGTGATGGIGATGGTGGTGGTGAGGTGGTGGGVGVDDPNPSTRCSGNQVVTPIVFPANTQWAASVIAMSSEYTSSSWSAAQSLGAPNTYPSHGDLTTAWATFSSDLAGEYLAVAFSPAATGSMIYIVETYHPDAVSSVTLTLQGGGTSVVHTKTAASVGDCAYVLGVPTGTTQPITQVRIDLGSELVTGWNEIDAIGVVP
jgi:hypothetical protein